MFPIIVAICVIIFCLIFLRKPGDTRKAHPTIPGPTRNSKDVLEFEEIDILKRVESLRNMQRKYGPIVAFEKNGVLSVVISDPELLKETRNMSYVLPQRAEALRNILGDDSFAFVSDEEALERRKKYDLYFMMKACKTHLKVIKEVSEEFITKMQNNSGKIPLRTTTNNASMKTVLCTTFGGYFKDDEKLKSFQEEILIIGNLQAKVLKEGSEECKALKAAVNKIMNVVKEIIEHRRKEPKDPENVLFIDVLVESEISEGQRNSDGIGIFLGSETLNFIFMWLFYHLITNEEVQNKVQEEIENVLGDDEITKENIPKLKYLRQVIDETLRIYNPIHTARVAETDLTIGGHHIPKGTVIYQNLDACQSDPQNWKQPNEFCPDNFEAESSKTRHPYVFKPFGFAGKRTCPGMSYSYVFLITIIASWFRKFKFTMLPDQTVIKTSLAFPRLVNELYFSVNQRK